MWFNICLLVAFAVCCEGGTVLNNKQKLIYDGIPLNITQAPYMAQYYTLKSACGAAIIHERFAISASHCYKNETEGKQYLLVGSDKNNKGERYDIKKAVIHPRIKKTNHLVDAVVLMLNTPLQLSDRVKPIKLAPQNLELKAGDVLTVIGFGKAEKTTPHLLGLNVSYITNEDCKAIPGTVNIIDTRICAGGVSGEGVCLGDSGGPLVYNDVLVGIVSYLHKGCAHAMPDVYTRVSAIRDFIDTTINDLKNSDEDKLVMS